MQHVARLTFTRTPVLRRAWSHVHRMFQGENDMAAKRGVETIAPISEATTGEASDAATNVAVETLEAAGTGFTETVSALKDGMSGAAAGFEKTQSDIKEK